MLSNYFYKGVGRNGVRGEWGTVCDFLFAFLDDETLFKCRVYLKGQKQKVLRAYSAQSMRK